MRYLLLAFLSLCLFPVLTQADTTQYFPGEVDSESLRFPHGIAIDANSGLIITDVGNHQIKRITPEGMVEILAGTGVASFSGDSEDAKDAALSNPVDVAVDKVDSIYIADRNNHRIRKIDANGIITTIAGIGVAGFSGDGGDARKAQLNFPSGLAIGKNGTIWISDRANHRIRKIDTHGIITTIAGTGSAGFSGDGEDAKMAQLNFPAGLASDDQHTLYIADQSNHRIRKIDANGVISTIAGTGEFGFMGDAMPAIRTRLASPSFLALDPENRIYFTDSNNQRVRRIDPDGSISTLTINLPGTQKEIILDARLSSVLKNPMGLAWMAPHDLFVADSNNHRILKVSIKEKVVDPVTESPPSAPETSTGENKPRYWYGLIIIVIGIALFAAFRRKEK